MKQNLKPRFRIIDDKYYLNAIFQELRLANKNHHKLYWTNIILIVFTVVLFLVAAFTYLFEQRKNNIDEMQKRREFTYYIHDKFINETIGDSVIQKIFNHEEVNMNIFDNHVNNSINKLIYFCQELNHNYKTYRIDTGEAKILFSYNIDNIANSKIVNNYIYEYRNDSQHLCFPLRQTATKESIYGSEIFILAKRYNICVHDSINMKWERRYYVDELIDENLFQSDTIRIMDMRAKERSRSKIE